MHRRTREIPAGMIVGFLALLVMAVSLFYALFAIAGPAPAAASTDMLQPAVSAASRLLPYDPWLGVEHKPYGPAFRAWSATIRH